MRELYEDVVMVVFGKYFFLLDCVNCEMFFCDIYFEIKKFFLVYYV